MTIVRNKNVDPGQIRKLDEALNGLSKMGNLSKEEEDKLRARIPDEKAREKGLKAIREYASKHQE